MLRDEGIQFQVCKNPCVHCAVVERAHRSMRDSLYKYFNTKIPSDIYIYILP